LPGQYRIAGQSVDAVGQPSREEVRVEGIVRRYIGERHIDDESRLAVHDDFRNAADAAGNNGRSARHCLKVYDAERLIYRGTAKDARMRIERDDSLPVEHFWYPDEA
jgi:hypothetical protein